MEWLFFGLILLGLAGVYFSIIGFPLFMLLILLLTGIIWLVDYLFFQKSVQRLRKSQQRLNMQKAFSL